MAIYQLGDLIPQIDPTAFIFDSADIIGDVVIDAGASVWANCSIRGDNTRIHVGKNSNIQEGSVLHVDPDTPLVIEEHVTIGHQAMLHGCTIASGSLIGMQAIVLNHAKIGRNCLIGVGKIARALSDEEIANIRRNNQNYAIRAQMFRQKLKRIA